MDVQCGCASTSHQDMLHVINQLNHYAHLMCICGSMSHLHSSDPRCKMNIYYNQGYLQVGMYKHRIMPFKYLSNYFHKKREISESELLEALKHLFE
jgi:hypothetical protein